jgi:hypothetical protein
MHREQKVGKWKGKRLLERPKSIWVAKIKVVLGEKQCVCMD